MVLHYNINTYFGVQNSCDKYCDQEEREDPSWDRMRCRFVQQRLIRLQDLDKINNQTKMKNQKINNTLPVLIFWRAELQHWFCRSLHY